VGYGKTEVAIRACFRAVHGGRQAVVLVPTTVLAAQHDETFKERLAEFPVRVETISRLRSKKEQTQVVADAAAGKVDILIGTHRLLSKDIALPNLGLVVIDEEQRFGVKHKERFKQMRTEVDVLTMTATPIPRTLNLSMLGLRDISTLATPPVDRQDVYTEVCTFDPGRIRLILMRELDRKGQVYFVHNRVLDIEAWREKLQDLVPEARIVVGHGQMAEGELERAMLAFTRHEADILLCTTIIESGIDNPRANTIVIDRSDLFGLADLHQLRGRVGRSKVKAYAYFIVPESGPTNPAAAKRIHAIEEFSQLGSGFKIAMRDLEIRGAGNVLGAEQSGHIAAVGYELYCELLRRAAGKLKNEPQQEMKTIAIDLGIETRIPDNYVRDARTRFELYRRFAHADTDQATSELRAELIDRFGPIGAEVENCFLTASIRNLCRRLKIRSIVDAADHYILIAEDLAAIQRPFQAISEFVGVSTAYETRAAQQAGGAASSPIYLRTPGVKQGLARAKFARDLLAAAVARK
jgi:transcription-repair coupling factor (superfamily II helicase)